MYRQQRLKTHRQLLAHIKTVANPCLQYKINVGDVNTDQEKLRLHARILGNATFACFVQCDIANLITTALST
jgi:hypothetical protein